jgi:hypothetical protein
LIGKNRIVPEDPNILVKAGLEIDEPINLHGGVYPEYF